MPIDVACAHCGCAYSVKDDAAGRRFKCKECGDVIEVPGMATGVDEPPRLNGPVGGLAGSDQRDGPESADAPHPRRQRSDDVDDAGSPNALGKVSLILGCVVWGLGVVSMIALMVMGFSAAQMMEQNGGRPPDQREAMQIGFMALGACSVGCLGLVASLVGAVLGAIAVSQNTGGKGQAVAGLILNGLYLLGGTALLAVSIIANLNR